MGKLEALQKRIDQVADKVRNLRYMIIVLMSSIVGTIFGISQHKILDNILVNIFLLAGTIGLIGIIVLVRAENTKGLKMSFPVAFALIGVFGSLYYMIYTEYKDIKEI